MSGNARDLALLLLRNVTSLESNLRAFINCLDETTSSSSDVGIASRPTSQPRERALSSSSQASSSSSSSSSASKEKAVAKRPIDVSGDKPAPKKAKVVKDDTPKKAKKVKDPNLPKRPMTGFLLFNQDHRDSVAKANPTAKATEIMTLLAARWKDATASVKEKYTKQAAVAKERYTLVKKAYVEEKADAATTRVSFSEPTKKKVKAKAVQEVDLFHSAFDETFDEVAWDDEEVEHKKKKKEKKEKKEKRDREFIFDDDDE